MRFNAFTAYFIVYLPLLTFTSFRRSDVDIQFLSGLLAFYSFMNSEFLVRAKYCLQNYHRII